MAIEEAAIPLSQIEVDPENVRSEYDPDIVTGLRSALHSSGEYINPPTVYPIGPDRYRVQHGSTRVLAAQGVVKTLRVRMVDPPHSEGSKLLAQMSENLLQGNLRPADIGNALKRLRYAEGRERSISQLVGALKAGGIERTKTWVAMHLALAELAPEVQRLVNQGRLAAEAAYALRSLPREQQSEWGQRIVEQHLTREEVRRQLGLGAEDHEMSVEHLQRELEDRLQQATLSSEQGPNGRRPPSAERRHGSVVTRRELLPVPVEDTDARRVRRFSSGVWAEKASDTEKQLAQEALFIGGYSASQAIQLVERATQEAQTASEAIMATLNAARRLLEHPAELAPDSALAEFLAMRLRRILENIGRS